MKKIVGIIVISITVLFLAACSSGKVVYEQQGGKLPKTGHSWTVLVYMCGGEEETLSATSSDKLSQLMAVDYPENVNVLVQTGGSQKWHINGIYSDYAQRFEVGKGTMYLADQALCMNMGDYNTLSNFLSWGKANYKSDNYMLIISGAGGGSIHGSAYDELYENDSLNLEEISYAMSVSGANFDIVGFDSSLMGSLETATALSVYADYMVAPQDVLYTGWDYTSVLQYISNNPSIGAEEISKVICDAYYNKCVKNNCEADAAMSVVDMSKISTLNQAFDGMAGDMLTATDGLLNYAELSKTLDSVQLYGGGTEDEGYSNLIDLGDIAVKSREYVGNTADVLINAMNDSVIYRVCGERKQNSTGLSVYYPVSPNNDELQAYMEISMSNKYKEFLRKICVECSVTDEADTEDFTSSWAWSSYNNDMQLLEYNSILDSNLYELNILGNMDLFKNISINVYKQDKKSGGYVYLGKYKDIDNDWECGIFKDNFNGKMARLCGKVVTMRLVRSYTGYDVYSIPIILNGERSNVRVIHDTQKNKYDIMGAWGGIDPNTGKAGKAVGKLGFFDRITPVLFVYDEEHNLAEYITGSFGLKLFGGVKNNNIVNGEYILEYVLDDIYGMNRYGTPVKGVASGGKIQFELRN